MGDISVDVGLIPVVPVAYKDNLLFFLFFSFFMGFLTTRYGMMEILSAWYPWIKSLHVISVIAWMAGLFYLPRLFVYHTEQVVGGSPTDKMFQTMERRLLRAIMNPAMIATWVFGLMVAFTPGVVDWSAGWPWVKAVSVIGLTWFHHWCGRRRRDFIMGRNTRSGRHYRMMNEVPTILLIVIVVAVIARPF